MSVQNPSYIYLRNGIYYFQYRIPKSVSQQFHIPQKLIRKSLGTGTRVTALRKARRLFVLMDDKIDILSKIPIQLSKIRDFSADSEEFYSVEGKKDYEKISRDFQLSHYIEQLCKSRDKDIILELLENLTDKESNWLEQAPAIQSQVKTILKYGDGVRKVEQNSAINQNQIFPDNNNFSEKKYRISELLEKFISEKTRGWNPKAAHKNETEYRGKIGTFIEFLGNDKFSTELKMTDVVEYKEAIMRLPTNRKKVAKYRTKTIQQLLKLHIPQEKRLSNETLKNNFLKVGAFLNWLYENGYIETQIRSPIKSVIKKKVTSSNQRQVFTKSDLKKLFESDDYVSGKHKKTSHYWVPLLGLLTGCRQNELCQLYIEDVVKDEKTGIWYLDINDDKDKKLKNLSSNRKVPIHKILIQKFHFIQWIEQIKKDKQERLFSDLENGRDGYAEKFSKWFNRTYRQRHCKVGLKKDEKKDFHSFRHTFANWFKQHRVEEKIVSGILGHSSGSSITYERYGKDYNLKTMKQTIDKLNFNLDFGKIQQWRGL